MVSLIGVGKDSQILEPSCGEGVFLHSLEKSGYCNISAYEIDSTLKNPYKYVKYESFITSPTSDKFNVVIGNPPYIRWKNLENELKKELYLSPLWKQYFNSLCDYLFIFILKSIEQLYDNGELIFICPEYWMNTTHSCTLRDYMLKNGSISEIYLFKEAPLFEGVTSSFVIFKYIKSKRIQHISLYKYNKKGKPLFEELSNKSCFDQLSIPQFNTGERWLLASTQVRNSIISMEKACRKYSEQLDSNVTLHRVGDFCDIGNGMVSGMDKAFCIKDISNLNEIEKASLIHVYKAKDLQQYYNIADSYYFFLRDDISEYTFKERYPNIYAKLQLHRDNLLKRYNYGRDLKIWEFAFPRNEALFKQQQERIFVPCKERISHKQYFRFAIADYMTFPLQDVTAILKKHNCKENIYYILAYLNSSRVFEWLKYNGIVKGDIVEFSETPLASIPYRCINWDNEQEVMCHDNIVKYTQQYVSTKDVQNLSFIEANLNTLFYMSNIDYKSLLSWLKDKEVNRPNAADKGTLSGHAAGEPFEKLVYRHLKELYPTNIYKQFEYLNDLYRRNPTSITVRDRQSLFNSPVALFLLSRGDTATRNWDTENIFVEKQNDTADILFQKEEYFELIDVKTRNISKSAQAPNIISAYKVAQMCAIMLDNKDFNNVSINYIEIDWKEKDDKLVCAQAHYGSLFKATPSLLYINWAAAMQIQFHVSELDQTYAGTIEEWAKAYLKMFVASAEHHCKTMYEKYVKPFKQYVE